MKRTYELGLVLDPNLTDEQQVEQVDAVKILIAETGAEVVKEESWGKRKLAYPISKVNEGRYYFLYLVAEGKVPQFRDVENRLNQNENVLRYLVVRTDQDLRRAVGKGTRHVPAAEAVGFQTGKGGADAAVEA